MYKYIQDSIKNNSRCVLKGLTKPQQKALGEPILRHIAQDSTKSAKKQAEKYSHHLGNIQIQEKVEELALKEAKKQIRKSSLFTGSFMQAQSASADFSKAYQNWPFCS